MVVGARPPRRTQIGALPPGVRGRRIRDEARGKAPAPVRPPPLKPGQKMWRLRQGPGEDLDAAIARARTMPWWPQVITARPTWSCGHWIFIAVDIAAGNG